MRRKYTGLYVVRMEFGVEESILAGSVTTEPIKIENVTVEGYKNGFESEPDGFKEINFD